MCSSISATHPFTLLARATSKAINNARLISFAFAVLLAGGTVAVRGQSALDGFNPNPDGIVRVVVVQPDGKILIGGDFTSLSPNGGAPVTRNRIARLNPDGTLDAAFNPNSNGPIYSIALQADGKVLACGAFNGANSIGGQTRNHIARLDAITGLADAFNPNANTTVYTIAVQADGKILAGGDFNGANSIGGQTRNRIARLDATTGAADSFNPDADDHVFSIVVQADGKILAGGFFTNIGGQTRNCIARLNPTTGLADSFNPNANSSVFALALQPDGKILVGGDFNGANSIGGQTRNYIARLDATTGLADSFDPNANSDVLSIAVQADGKILVGGFFSAVSGQGHGGLARLEATTGLPDSLDGNVGSVISVAVQTDGKILVGGISFIIRLETDGRADQTLNLSIVGADFVIATAVQPDGKILIGGDFNSVLGQPRNNIARLNTDGTLDMTFNPDANAQVNAIFVQADGDILAAGQFTTIGGQTRHRIARLDATSGSADAFNPNANEQVKSIVVQEDGKILVDGEFTIIGGQTRNFIARLDATTGSADSFNPTPNDLVLSIAVQPDGKILAGGEFTTIGGQTRNHIARLDATTGFADSFNPNANAILHGVIVIGLQADGKILVGGDFTTIGGQTRRRIARLDVITGLADSFDPDPNDRVLSIAVQADGKILAGGEFTAIGGQTRRRIARLDASTGLADSFNPNAQDQVYSIAVQADGKILAGGRFVTIGGQSRNLFARLSNNTAALQDLAVTRTTITWTRGGSSPHLRRVTFEYSNDNVNYTSLGNGTAVDSNWTRTGLSLSTGRNFYIRARGYYRCGFFNGSESITESVRKAFNAGPTATDATISGRIIANDGTPLSGAIVNLTGTQTRKTINDADGNYRFDNIETGGFYTVTPARPNYSFGPASRSFSQLGNLTEAVFTGTPNSVIVGSSIDTPEYFVRQHYLDFLGREPDEGGFNFWSDQILVCGSDAACIERGMINVSAAYFLSIEFQQTGGLVDGLYRASYARRPLYAEFMPDTAGIAQGVIVGRIGWQQQLATNKAAFIDAFVQRPDFQAAFNSLSNDSFVDTLISRTGVNFSDAERIALVSGLSDGTMTRAAALRRIAENQQFANARRNEAFVMMEYFGYLRRDPDETGYQFWLNKLNRFDGNFERAEMVKAFINSGEYRARFPR